MIRCFLGLGSNLEQPTGQLRKALGALAAIEQSRLGQVSPFYANQALGPDPQPEFVNAVAEFFTQLEPLPLLRALQAIETAQGRVRTVRWGARTLDIDLLLYGDRVVSLPELQVPHYGLRERDFVLQPLYDLDPQLTLPDGTSLRALLDCCPSRGLQRL